MAPSNLVVISEYSHSPAGTKLRIDRENGIIFDVKILGEAGNDVYPQSTREKVIGPAEGARVNVDHLPKGDKERSYRDGFGVLKNLREKGDGVYADYHFPPKHALSEQLFWDAENAPHNLGFSIASKGRFTKRDPQGRRIIEEIPFDRRTDSFDLVS